MIKTHFINSTVALYEDREFAFLQTLLFNEGVVGSAAGVLGLGVTQNSPTGMSVLVAAGLAVVEITKNGKTFKVVVENDASLAVAIAANSSGANRVDAIIVRVDVDAEPNVTKSNVGTIERIAGTGISALSDAAITAAVGNDGWYRLANITVANGASSIVTANIADVRTQITTTQGFKLTPEAISFSVVASDPVSPTEGMMWYNSTTHTLKYRDHLTTQTLATSLADATSTAGNDQTQTTRNGSIEVGEANATTKKNKLAQSFIAGKSKIRGVKLWKLVNLGTFTGDVTISLQADSAGSPSGSDLASKTFLNADWNALQLNELEAIFTSEVIMTVGATYWIVITCTTSDNSNHPALGTNTAGGYANGSMKYWNTTDGWVAIATVDLYFKTLEGINSQIVQTKTDGKISPDFLDRVYFQILALGTPADYGMWTSFQDGSWAACSGSNEILRILRRNRGGSYPAITDTWNYSTFYPASGTNYYVSNIFNIGAYTYVNFNTFGTGREAGMVRFPKNAISGAGTKMTISGGSWAALNLNGRGYAFTDGTFIYVWISSTTWQKYSISGTTLTYVADVTFVDPSTFASGGFAYDNEYVYTLTVSGGNHTLNKYDIATQAIVESRLVFANGSIYSSTSASATQVRGIFMGASGAVYLVVYVRFSTAASDGTGGAYYLTPVFTS